MIPKVYLVTISYGHNKERRLLASQEGLNILEDNFQKKTTLLVILPQRRVSINMEFVQEIEAEETLEYKIIPGQKFVPLSPEEEK